MTPDRPFQPGLRVQALVCNGSSQLTDSGLDEYCVRHACINSYLFDFAVYSFIIARHQERFG